VIRRIFMIEGCNCFHIMAIECVHL
jgi:hypothetical protein